jgi:signal peptidase I
MSTVLLLCFMAVAALLFMALFLWLGARLAHVPKASLFGAFLTLLIVVNGWLCGAILVSRVPLPTMAVPSDVALLLSDLAIPTAAGMLLLLWLWFVSRLVLRANTAQVIFAWLPTVAPFLLIWCLLTCVVRPYVVEAYYLRSNSMAPTLLALHHTGTCPHCGCCAFVPYSTNLEFELPTARLGMCSECRRLGRIADTSREIHFSDRFMVNKCLTPRRWDLVLFRDPRRNNQSVRFVKRLVGLPGEELVIRDGALWINGERLEVPADLRGLEFSTKQFSGEPIYWATEENPAKLGPDEYFVLDDFSVRSNDSRMWMAKSKDRPAYALPGSHIEGVVAFIYWPQYRSRILR